MGAHHNACAEGGSVIAEPVPMSGHGCGEFRNIQTLHLWLRLNAAVVDRPQLLAIAVDGAQHSPTDVVN